MPLNIGLEMPLGMGISLEPLGNGLGLLEGSPLDFNLA
jgi:hypothetical protein